VALVFENVFEMRELAGLSALNERTAIQDIWNIDLISPIRGYPG
jgi:hypothetical protein